MRSALRPHAAARDREDG